MFRTVTAMLAATCLAAPLTAQDVPSTGNSKRATVKQRVHERADRNDDGKVGPVERRKARRRVVNHKRNDAWQKFAEKYPDAAAEFKAKADTDGDGVVNADERAKMHKFLRDHRSEMKERFKDSELFDRMDKNDDGKIGRVERKVAGRKTRQHVRGEVKDRLDKNDDGKVGRVERKHARKQVRQRADRNDDGRVGPRERKHARGKAKSKAKRQVRKAARPPR